MRALTLRCLPTSLFDYVHEGVSLTAFLVAKRLHGADESDLHLEGVPAILESYNIQLQYFVQVLCNIDWLVSFHVCSDVSREDIRRISLGDRGPPW